MDIIELFKLGMKRDIVPLLPAGATQVNLGCGIQRMPNCLNLDLPDWNAETGAIPCDDQSVDTIWAFHFFEHLSGKDAIRMLRECQRVLKVGGALNIVVPHRLSQMAYHDLDHKSFYCEETWRNLFSTPYYEKNRELPWMFTIRTNVVIGIVERNLALLTQLERK